jgi:hypothetical protein
VLLRDIELKSYATTELPSKFQEEIKAEQAVGSRIKASPDSAGPMPQTPGEMDISKLWQQANAVQLTPDVARAPQPTEASRAPTLADFLRSQSSSPDKQERK